MPSRKRRKSLFLDDGESSDLDEICSATGLSQSELVRHFISLARKKIDLERSPTENVRCLFGSP